MNLLTLGDSFTYGEELNDRNQAWPQQLANLIGYQLINLGVPSNSNPGMRKQLVQHFAEQREETPDLVIIGWSSPGRMEFSDPAGSFSIWPGYSGNLFKQHEPWRTDLLDYINRYHSDEHLYEMYLQDIVLTQEFLKSKGIRCLMLNTVGNEYYKNIFGGKFDYYTHLIDTNNFVGWSKEGMAEWTDGCPKGPNGHFLDEGHNKVANKVYEHIRNLGWLS
jgi:hypothetical protein